MCVDIRLKTNPDIEIVRANAVDDEHIQKVTVSDQQNCSEAHDGAEISVNRDAADREYRESKSGPSLPIPVRVTSGKRMHSTRQVETKDEKLEITKRARMDSDLSITVLPKPNVAQRCPFPNCDKREKIKRHVQRFHLPKIFCDIRPMRCMDETALCQLQYSSLLSLVTGALGQDADVYTAVDYVNQCGSIPKNTTVHPDTIKCMKKLCVSQGWMEPPEGFTVSPVNSPAALFHWRCLVVLLALLQPTQCEEFRTIGHVTSVSTERCNEGAASKDPIVDGDETLEDQDPTVDSSTEDELTVIDVSYGSDVEVGRSAVTRSTKQHTATLELYSEEIITVDEAFDSHLHLDRTSSRIWKTKSGKTYVLRTSPKTGGESYWWRNCL
jgi:hypothetical protein